MSRTARRAVLWALTIGLLAFCSSLGGCAGVGQELLWRMMAGVPAPVVASASYDSTPAQTPAAERRPND